MIEYKAFFTPEEVTQWVDSSYSQEYLLDLDIKNNQDSPLADYKGNFYRIINQYLRAGCIKSKDYDIEGFQKMLSSCTLPNDIITYRFVSMREWINIKFGTMFGKVYIKPEFLSTTLLKKYYNMEDIKTGRICIKILAPKGALGTYIPEVNPNSPEYEVLFAHHCKLKRNGFNIFIMI